MKLERQVVSFLSDGTFGSKDLAKLSSQQSEGLDLLRAELFNTL